MNRPGRTAVVLAALILALTLVLLLWTSARGPDGAGTPRATDASPPPTTVAPARGSTRRARANDDGAQDAPAPAPEPVGVEPPARTGVASSVAVPGQPTPDTPPAAIRVQTNVPFAEVTVEFRHFSGAPESPPVTRAADETGLAVVEIPAHPERFGWAKARATAPDHIPEQRNVDPDGRVALNLRPGVPIRGRVVSEDGAPIAGAYVWPDDDGGDGASTAPDGSFEVWTDAAGPVRLEVSHDAHLTAETRAAAPATDVRIVLGRGLSIEGRVALPDGTPVAGVTVWTLHGERQALSDEEGRYVLSGLAAGEHEISCRSVFAEERRAQAGATGVTLVVPRAVAQVRVVDEDGHPFRNAALLVRSGSMELRAGGGDEATFTFSAKVGERTRIVASARGYDHDPVEFLPDAARFHTVTIVLRRAPTDAAIALRVRGESGAPPYVVPVRIRDDAGRIVEGYDGRRVIPASDGNARLEGLPPGRLRVTICAEPSPVASDGFDVAVTADVTVAAGSVTPLDVTIARGGRVVVTVRDPSGRVVAPGRLSLLDASGRAVAGEFRRQGTDDAAPWQFGTPVPAGSYRVRAEPEGRAPVECETAVVAGRVAEVELRLSE